MTTCAASPHWAAGYIGLPWIAHDNDCWSFCRRVWAERFGLAVPAIDVDADHLAAVTRSFLGHPERARWAEVVAPVEGDAVLLAHSRFPTHVGIWVDIDGGGVLHCEQASGVVFSRPGALARCGWAHLSFYRHEERA